MIHTHTIRASLLAALLLPGLATAAGLNDTGITGCANDTQNNLICPQEPNFPRQDADIGRDAQATARKPTLSKAGGGLAGFDFTKLDASGNPLPADATSWDCVRDNVTGLIWEIKTDDDGLRDKDWTYAWYNTDFNTNGGFEGFEDGGLCGSGGVGFPEHCNTQAYVAAVNAAALCGYNTGWRMPTFEELGGIMDYSGIYPTIDAAYFPNTSPDCHRSASPSSWDLVAAWLVCFDDGDTDALGKGGGEAVRLVRGGPSLALETTPTSDFTLDDVNGTAYHQKTGLTWKRCYEGSVWNGTTCIDDPNVADIYNWSQALQLGPASTFAGFNDWRLPNLKELQSIVERQNWHPAINATVFSPTTYGVGNDQIFWSASPSAPYASWYVNFAFGHNVSSGGKVNGFYAVRLVRGGQYSLLSVTKDGTGSGTVTSNPSGIDCGPYCKGSFPNEMFATAGEIILTANPDANSDFAGWEGCTPLESEEEVYECTFALNKVADTSVTANFSPKPTSTLSITDVSQNEGNKGKNFTFTITLSPASTGTVTVTVNYATADGTARLEDSDYTVASGTLTFEAGQTRKTVTVNVIGDKAVEPDETFFVNLSNPSGAAILDEQGLGTIINDDK